MIEWIETVLGVIAIVCVFLGIIIILMMMNAVVKRMKKTKKEKKTMSKEKGETVTFNDIFMFMIGVPLVLLWVGFAGFVIHSGLGKPEVLENIEAYTTLIAILGGPALLIIKDALDVWKQEQAEKTSFYKIKAQSVIDYNDATQKQTQMIEAKAQEQEHKMEIKK